MSGLSGLAKADLKSMSKADLLQDSCYGLYPTSSAIPEPATQLLWNEDQSVSILLEGEFFGYQDTQQFLVNRGHHFKVNNDAEFALHLYEEFGDNFALHLNGSFVVAIWDRRVNKLILVNDRLGSVPLYYAQCSDSIAFASSLEVLLSIVEIPRRVDPVGIVQFLTFDHLLGNRTLLCDVKLLPPASLLTFQDNLAMIQTYWDLEFPDFHKPKSEQEYVNGLVSYMKQAIARQTPGDMPAGILLSGGLDSRMVLALLRDRSEGEDLYTFTFGIPGCDDARFAQEVAARLGTQHHFFELKPDYLSYVAEQGVRLTDGMGNCVHMHALATLATQAEYANIFYKGFMGDALMGYFSYRELFAHFKADALIQLFLTHYPITFNFEEQKRLLTKSLYKRVDGAAIKTLRNCLAESGPRIAADKYYHFDIRQRQRRLTLNGVRLVRSQGVVRSPFCDNDLIDYMQTIPAGLRFERYLMKKAFIQSYPELAKIPTTETGFPMVSCMRDLSLRANRQVRWRLRAAGLNWVPVQQQRPYMDYDRWLRTELRSWVEGILLSDRALERAYFNPTYIRELVAAHMAGSNHARKLGALLTIEISHRQFID